MMDSHDERFAPRYYCRDCGSEVGFRSRRRNFAEKFILPLFLLQPVRCGECFRRDYRLIFTAVHERMPEAGKIGPSKAPSTSQRNVA
jgi:hypothetical protein